MTKRELKKVGQICEWKYRSEQEGVLLLLLEDEHDTQLTPVFVLYVNESNPYLFSEGTVEMYNQTLHVAKVVI